MAPPHYFALALTIGILFGIYSSVFVAAAIAMWLGVNAKTWSSPAKGRGSQRSPSRSYRLDPPGSVLCTPRPFCSAAWPARRASVRRGDLWWAGGPGQDGPDFTALMNQTGTAREMQSRRDAWLQYQQNMPAWTQRTGRPGKRPWCPM